VVGNGKGGIGIELIRECLIPDSLIPVT